MRMRRILIRALPIELGPLLKLANLADTGGQAKLLIEHGEVRVNGSVELRRGRKLTPGDVVEVAGHEPVVVDSE
jgi:ribosome-associated protein